MKWEYTQDEIEEAIKFVIKDNPKKKWKNLQEVADAADEYLAESTVISNLEELIKDGLVEEIAPNRFVPTKKGLELFQEMKDKK